MLAQLALVLLAAALCLSPAESTEPLLETNSPPYTLVNFALEVDPRVDQIGEIQQQSSQERRKRLETQFVGQQPAPLIVPQSQRRAWLDAQFDELRRKQKRNREGGVPGTMIRWAPRLLAAIRPSGLSVRVPRGGIADDSRNVNRSLRSIRKELGIAGARGRAARSEAPAAGDEDPANHRVDDVLIESAQVNLRNRFHRNIWLAMKRRDRPQFDAIEKQLRASNVDLDGVSYTLLVHGHVLFRGMGAECLGLLREMRERGVHPALIRLNARVAASCAELAGLGARPLAANVVQVARASWLAAVMVTRRYRRPEDALRREAELDAMEADLLPAGQAGRCTGPREDRSNSLVG